MIHYSNPSFNLKQKCHKALNNLLKLYEQRKRMWLCFKCREKYVPMHKYRKRIFMIKGVKDDKGKKNLC